MSNLARKYTGSTIFTACIVYTFYFYSSNKWRAFYKQLNNKHCTCSIINKHVFREMTCEIYNQKWHNTHKDININTLDTHWPELCGLQTQGLNNTYVRVCVVRVCVHVCECVFIHMRAPVCVCVFRCACKWDLVVCFNSNNRRPLTLASILYEQFDRQ